MKKFNWLMMLLATVALSFVACEDPQKEPTPGPGPDQPTALTFEVEVGEVTYSTVNYKVTPSDLEAEYLCILYDAETVEEFTKDEYLVATLLQELEADARSKGMTLKEYMPEILDKGVLESKYERLAPESEYYIIVFGVDAAKDYELCSAVSKTKVTTLAAPKIDISFEINTTVDGNSAEYEVIPSDTEAIWYFYTLPKATYDAYTDPAGNYQMDDTRFILFCLSQQIEALRGAGYTDNEILNAIFHKGALTLMAKDLNANTEYINLVAAFDITEAGEISIISDVTTTTYTSGDVAQKELSFEISVTDVEAMRAAIKVTPSNNSDTFYWQVGAWDGVQTAEDIMNSVVSMYGAWMNAGMMLYTGVQDYTGGPGSPYKFRLDAADTEHYIVVFGYAGGITTEPVMATFKTLPAPAAEDTTFEMTATEITPYSFKINITPSESTTYYSMNICLPGEFDEEAIIAAANQGFDETLAMYKEWDPNTTVTSVLSMYYRGPYSNIEAKGLTPETSYMGFVVALDPATGHVVKLHKFENLATTTAVGSITPGIELVGYYSGKDEAGTIFGQPEATANVAITVVKYTNIDGARSLFTTMLGGVLTNPATEPDAKVWGDAASYWQSTKVAQPYSFYIADWEYEQTALAYAVDQNGLVGGIGRLYTMPTAENKSDIEELRALVNELNEAEKAFVLPASLVVGESSGITLGEGTPVVDRVEESVAEVKAEMPALNNNRVFVGGGYIRPFYL